MRKLFSATAMAVVVSLVLSACSGGNSANSPGDDPVQSLVIDTAFALETADPARNYVPTGNMVLKAVYETLLDFRGGDVSKPVPGLAEYEQNEDATEFTFTLQQGRVFSDGAPITADDVVFSLERVKGITDSKANFLMDGIEISKVDDRTVQLRTDAPALQLPAIVANPALGIVNSKLVQNNGGTTDNSDSAQPFLDATSAGSGPYQIQTFDLTSQVVLVPNASYNGAEPAAIDRVVIRNVAESATQLTNLQGGDSDLALDLSGDQVSALGDRFEVVSSPSAETIFLLLNQDAAVAKDLANPQFAEAIRYALDYPALLELAGAGAVQATGVIPPSFPGAQPQGIASDPERAKTALGKSGYRGQKVSLRYPNDNPVGGVEFTPLAERIQSQLESVGITVELAPAPFATEIDPYVNGQEAFSMWYWGPDYPDSTSFLPFGPGEKVGLRAGWETSANETIAKQVTASRQATSIAQRDVDLSAYAKAMQESGPFVPLIVPGASIASSRKVTGIAYDPTWTLDIAELKPV